jgi:hypothetical protein
MKLGRLIARRDRDQMNADVLESDFIAERLIGPNRRWIERVNAANTFHCSNSPG